MTDTPKTRSQEIAADVAALLRARNPLLWVVTKEEQRAESYLFEAASSAGYITRFWDVAQGVSTTAGEPVSIGSADPDETLAAIAKAAKDGTERCVWIMRDLPALLTGPATRRALRNLARSLPSSPRERAQAIIVLSPSNDIPPDLAGHATVIEWTLPDRAEIAGILDAAIGGLPEEMQTTAAPNGTRDAAIDAAIGLSGEEAASCYARSLVQHRRIDPRTVANEKKRVIAREKVLEWIDPLSGGLDAVGGLDVLKGWLISRKNAYSPQARAYGLPSPKGAMLVGVPGCGKSLTAKAIATAWGVPLLKMDLGALKGRYVGESETNIRKAFSVIEAIGRCVVWLDEIEKGLGGAIGGGNDGGVSTDALGAILTWMQDRKTEAFVLATANDVSKLPPELLRKGRFDELFFVDLPTYVERHQVLKAALKNHGRADFAERGNSEAESEWDRLCEATADFTGSEIAELVPTALYTAFADGGREITAADLIAAAKTTVPLAKTAKGKIDALRQWQAEGRARHATTQDAKATTKSTGRALDL